MCFASPDALLRSECVHTHTHMLSIHIPFTDTFVRQAPSTHPPQIPSHISQTSYAQHTHTQSLSLNLRGNPNTWNSTIQLNASPWLAACERAFYIRIYPRLLWFAFLHPVWQCALCDIPVEGHSARHVTPHAIAIGNINTVQRSANTTPERARARIASWNPRMRAYISTYNHVCVFSAYISVVKFW